MLFLFCFLDHQIFIALKFLLKPTPVACEYSFPVFANALDPDGDEIDVTMSLLSVKKILVRLTKAIPVNHNIFSVLLQLLWTNLETKSTLQCMPKHGMKWMSDTSTFVTIYKLTKSKTKVSIF